MNDHEQPDSPSSFNPRNYFTPAIPNAPAPPSFPTLETQPRTRRIPHLGHAILFIVLTLVLWILSTFALISSHHPHGAAQTAALAQQPRISVLSELIAYVLTLGISALIFPALWDRTFSAGIQWNAAPARRLAARLIPAGITLGFVVELINSRLPQPEKMPIDNFFRNPADVWLITAFGTLLAPAFEEILFRGFLLPAFAIAWDWIALRRNAASLALWDTSDTLSRPALIFSAIVTSLLFIALHAAQLAGSASALATLFLVSLVFTWIRLHYRSVAVSALLHSSYNLSVFLLLFITTGGYRHLDRLTH